MNETLRLYSAYFEEGHYYVCAVSGIVCNDQMTFFKTLNAWDEFIWENSLAQFT